MNDANTSIPIKKSKVINRPGTGMFGKDVLTETIDMLPNLPDTESLDKIRDFLRANLHFSAEQTRQRNACYIVRRMFGEGYADKALRYFAKAYEDKKELKEVCLYRFLRAEPVALEVIEELLIPNVGTGDIERKQIRDLLKERYIGSENTYIMCSDAIAKALKVTGVATVDKKRISYAYREIPIASFAFILHSEFSEPGIYNMESLENNRYIKALLWNPERLIFTLYELRNQGLISKVSEIDSIRQFTMKYVLDELVNQLITQAT